jgi:uncharacterized protein YkuJ
MIKYFWAAAFSLLLAACNSNSPDSLTGTYGFEQNGKVVPLLKVEAKKDNTFALAHYEQSNQQWIPEADATTLTPAEFQQVFNAQPGPDMAGLKTNGMALAHVPKGWKSGNFTAKTGYLFRFMFGAQELVKIS